MNKSPINYLITIALGAFLWVITGIVIGGMLEDYVSLQTMMFEKFLLDYRIALGVAAASGVLNSLYWFFYGDRDSTVGELDKAQKIWNISLVFQFLVSAGVLSTTVFLLMAEGLTLPNYAVIFAGVSVHTYFFFWICTLFMSPRTVERIPLLSRLFR